MGIFFSFLIVLVVAATEICYDDGEIFYYCCILYSEE